MNIIAYGHLGLPYGDYTRNLFYFTQKSPFFIIPHDKQLSVISLKLNILHCICIFLKSCDATLWKSVNFRRIHGKCWMSLLPCYCRILAIELNYDMCVDISGYSISLIFEILVESETVYNS